MVLGGGTWDFLRVSCRAGRKQKNISFCIPADAMPDPADDTERDGAHLDEKCSLTKE